MKKIIVSFVNVFFIVAQVLSCPELSEKQIIKDCSISDDMFYDVWNYDGYCYVVVEDPYVSGLGLAIYRDCSLFVFQCIKNKWELKSQDAFYRNSELCEGTKNVIYVNIFKNNDDSDDGMVGLYYLNKGEIVPIDEYDFSLINNISLFKPEETDDVIGTYCQIKNVSVVDNKVSYTLITDILYYSEIKDEISEPVPLVLQIDDKFYHSDTIQVIKEIK